MKVEVHIVDLLSGERAIYRPGLDYESDDAASCGWEYSNDMCDANRLHHIARCNGHPQDDEHICGTERCFVKIVEIGSGRVIYEEEGYTLQAFK